MHSVTLPHWPAAEHHAVTDLWIQVSTAACQVLVTLPSILRALTFAFRFNWRWQSVELLLGHAAEHPASLTLGFRVNWSLQNVALPRRHAAEPELAL